MENADLLCSVFDSVVCRVFLRQHGLDELLRGGLAVGAGDGDDRNVELAAVLTSNVLQGLEAIIDSYDLRFEI